MEINNFSSHVVPYYSSNGNIALVLERKSPEYNAPYFNSALSLFGGVSKNEDGCAHSSLERELREEFWLLPDVDVTLDMGIEFNVEKSASSDSLDEKSKLEVQRIGKILMSNVIYVSDFIFGVKPPVNKKDINICVSVFLRELSLDELLYITNVQGKNNGKVTPDNLRWGSTTEVLTINQINRTNDRFAWGFDKVINHLISQNHIESNFLVANVLDFVSVRPFTYTGLLERESPKFSEYERLGIELRK